MKTKIIFVGLLGLAVMLASPATTLASPQDDYEKGLAAVKIKDYPEALRWHRKAAKQGNAKAQVSLGLMYKSGFGVKRDYAAAVSWFHKAAEQGNASAQTLLGAMYHLGQGVAQNDHEAMRWWNKSAEQGETQAQLILGSMYGAGEGVAQDYVQAHKWFNIAFALGYKDAKTGRQEVEKKMSAQQIGQAQREATKWLQAYEKRRK